MFYSAPENKRNSILARILENAIPFLWNPYIFSVQREKFPDGGEQAVRYVTAVIPTKRSAWRDPFIQNRSYAVSPLALE